MRRETDYEYTAEVPKMFLPEYPEPRITISVSKLGGGTLGESYEGLWEFRVYIKGNPVITGTDLRTGIPQTHEETARIVAGFLSSGQYNVPTDQLDRLAEFADGECDG